METTKGFTSVEYGTKLSYTTASGNTIEEEFWGEGHAQKALTFCNEQTHNTHYFTPMSRNVSKERLE